MPSNKSVAHKVFFFLLAVVSFLALLLFLFVDNESIDNYIKKDQVGKFINCDALTKHVKQYSGMILYDYEIKRGYKFMQCQNEIEKQHLARCDSFLKNMISNDYNYSHPYIIEDIPQCHERIRENLVKLNPQYLIHENDIELNTELTSLESTKNLNKLKYLEIDGELTSFEFVEIGNVRRHELTPLYKYTISIGEYEADVFFLNQEEAKENQIKFAKSLNKESNNLY